MSAALARIADAVRIAEQVVDDEVTVVRRVPCFAGNRVYRVRTETDTFYVKFAANVDIDRELSVLAALTARGVPVPEHVASNANGEIPHLVTREVAGQPLAPEEASSLRPLLDVVHSTAGIGFGSVRGTVDGGLVATDATWSEVIVARAAAASEVLAAGLLDHDLHDRVIVQVEAHRNELDAVTASVLLHGDLTMRHVYGDSTGITAIIDWGDATLGDPRYDIGRLVHASVASVGLERALLLATEACHAEFAQPRSLLLTYGAVFALWSMHAELASGDPWPPFFPAQRAVIETLIGAI